MLPDGTIPASLTGLLAVFGSCFTAPTYRTFTWDSPAASTAAGAAPKLTSTAATSVPDAGSCCSTPNR
jgi:hypothetical protein